MYSKQLSFVERLSHVGGPQCIQIYIYKDIFDFVIYYIIWTIRAIPTYRVHRLYDMYNMHMSLVARAIHWKSRNTFPAVGAAPYCYPVPLFDTLFLPACDFHI